MLENTNALGKKSSKLVFPLPESKVNAGTEVLYDGVSVIVQPGSGKTTSNVKIREKPSTGSKSLKYYDKIFYDPTAKEYDSVPRDTTVTIIARQRINIESMHGIISGM